MKLYGGIDLHARNNVVAVIDEGDRVIQCKRVSNDVGKVLKVLEPYRSELEGIGVESTYNWYWLVDGLMGAGHRVHLANPSAMKQYEGLKHSDDDTDAAWIAHLLRLNILPEGYIYPRAERPIRDLMRKRAQLVRQRTQNLLSLHNLIARNTGCTMRGNDVMEMSEEEIDLLLGNADLGLPLQCTKQVITAQNEAIRVLERRAMSEAKLRAEFRPLLTVDGIGNILAMTIMLETGTVRRFPTVGDFASYCRCVPSERLSNGKKKGSGNVKNGNKYLAWAFYEAATHAKWHSEEIRKFYQRKLKKTHWLSATKAIAHKLARACYYVLRDQVPFEVERAFV